MAKTMAAVAWGLGSALLAVPALAATTELAVFYDGANSGTDFMHQAAQLFEAQHPEITIKLMPHSGGGPDYAQKLAVLRAGGEMPDVYGTSADKLGYMMRGWALDVTPFVTRDSAEIDLNDYLPGTTDAFLLKGHLYGLPMTVTGQSVFYNPDLFSAAAVANPPANPSPSQWTWDEFTQDLHKLVRRAADGSATQMPIGAFGEYQLPDLAWIFGGDWFTAQGYQNSVATTSTFTRPENIEAYQAVQAFYKAGLSADAPGSKISAWDGFMKGQVAMDWIGWWKIGTYLSSGMNFKFGMAPMPLVKTRNNTLWTDSLFISSTTKHQEAAWQFVKFMGSPALDRLRTQTEGSAPTRRSALDAYVSKMQQSTDMTSQQIQAMLNGAVADGRRSLEQSIYGASELNQHMSDWLKPAITGQADVATTLAKVKPLVDTIVAKYAQMAAAGQ